MRLHQLTLTAFGPFGGTEHVDFDELSAAGVFLLAGPTGAGKTSILDAICFALYGNVPGAREGLDRLRSDHAAPGVAPRVELEFTCDGRRLRVDRSPAWQRPKKRGEGTTTAAHRVSVRELRDGEWVAVSTRVDEAAGLLAHVVGLTRQQFTRVVLLPQGEFATFLHAEDKDRKRLLESLFGTQRFSDLAQWLGEKRREAQHVASSYQTQCATTAEHLVALGADVLDADVLDVDALGCAEGTGSTDSTRGMGQVPNLHDESGEGEQTPKTLAVRLQDGEELALVALVAACEEHERVARAQAEDAENARMQTAELTEKWRAYTDAISALMMALAAHNDHHAQRDRVFGLRAEHDAGTRAAPVVAQARKAQQARERAQQARYERDRLRGVCDEHLAWQSLRSAAKCDDHVAQRELVERELGRALADEALDEHVRKAKQTENETQERAQQSREAAERSAEKVTRLRERRDAAKQRVAADADAAALLPAATEELTCAQRVLEGARAAAQAALRMAETKTALEQARVDEAARTDDVERVRAVRKAYAAASLACEVSPGMPCPVCGSCEHPRLAVAPDEPVQTMAEDTAVQAMADAARSVSTLTERYEELARQGELQREQAGGIGEDEASAKLAEARAACDTVRQRVQACEAARAEMEVLVGDVTAAEENHAALCREADVAGERHLAAVAAHAETLAAWKTARGDYDTVGARTRALRELSATLAEFARAAEASRHADALAEAAAAQAADALSESAFDSQPDALNASRTSDELQLMRQQIAEFDRNEAVVDEQLAAQVRQIAALALHAEMLADHPGDPTDAEAVATWQEASQARLGSAQARAAAASAQARAAAAAAGSATSGLARVRTASAQLRELHQTCADKLAAYAELDDLARMTAGTGGDNHRRMSLAAFVLAARLEQVAAAASGRLRHMSDGRYTLRHSAHRSKGAGQAGLGIVVLDAWTGHERPTQSLSGGESFIASLALALGLADVVLSEAGGTALDTLFVDEGFGTLDPGTLDDVMNVLDDLRDGGRAVGVISHVAEVKNRLTTGIEVRKTRTGSTLA